MSDFDDVDPSAWHRARRRRALVTLAVVALMLFFAFWYAYSYFQASSKPSSAAPPSVSCTSGTTAATPATTTVNVYNATQRRGLAAATAKELRKRGYVVSTVANDPLQRHVTGPAEVRFGPSGTARGALVLSLVKGARGVEDARSDTSVDLVLGDRFAALQPPRPAPAARATRATGRPSATATAPSC